MCYLEFLLLLKKIEAWIDQLERVLPFTAKSNTAETLQFRKYKKMKRITPTLAGGLCVGKSRKIDFIANLIVDSTAFFTMILNVIYTPFKLNKKIVYQLFSPANVRVK